MPICEKRFWDVLPRPQPAAKHWRTIEIVNEQAHPLRPIVILGPTAGGKSELAVQLAEQLPESGEVIGADSMQIYRQMDAGTAKPEPELRQRAKHHLIDIVEPTERFTVADWLEQVEQVIAQLQQAGRRPIVVGGTNLYLKVLLEGMFQAPAQDADFRASLADVPPGELHERLKLVDPPAAGRIHPNDRKRLIRALEVHHITGKPISAHQQQWQDTPEPPESPESSESAGRTPVETPQYRHNPILVGLGWPTEKINRRINARVRQMFDPAGSGLTWPSESLPDETRRLEDAGLLGPQAREALGYKQVLDAIHGRCSMADAFEQTKIQTRRFAKQQRTWLRRYRGVHWLDASELPMQQMTARILEVARG